jgi:transcriptional regulator of acetoin/glycerol metabolism
MNQRAALAAVKQAKGNVSTAAKVLGISRQMLYVLVPGGFHSRSS